jgi:class 3 adenylate cyclase/predicted ATPase
MIDRSDFGHAEGIRRSFGELLRWHLLRGTRRGSTKDSAGRKWGTKEFAAAVGVSDRTVRFWLQDQHLPSEIETIERVFFGDNVSTHTEWRLALRHAHEATRRKEATRPQDETPAVATTSPVRTRREFSLSLFERRPMTVIACRFSGLARLNLGEDLEDARIAKNNIQQVVERIVNRFGGLTLWTPGERLLVYFGYPEAKEDDAERAVRVGLELARVKSRNDLTPAARLPIQIGVVTGVMLVGSVDAPQEWFGEPLNLALDLLTSAPIDGSVVIAASTRALVGDFFNLEPLAPFYLEGNPDSITVWRVVEEKDSVSGRFHALRRTGMVEFVDRAEQMELLLRRWQAARNGVGQVVVLTGEAGIGKSRLASEFEERIAERHLCLNFYGLPYQANSSMFTIISELQSTCSFSSSDTASIRLSKLEGMMRTADIHSAENVALIASLMGLPADVVSPSGEAGKAVALLSPQRRKQRIFAALLNRIECLSVRNPLLVAIEDVQWIDPSSLDFIAMLVEHLVPLRLLLLVTHRPSPNFHLPWPEYSHISEIVLPRLNHSDAEMLVERVARGKILPRKLMNEVLKPSEGVPLFVEEMTKSLLESDIVGEKEAHDEFVSRRLQTIPKTLNGSLVARLDRLGAGREIAKIAAVIGREFSYALLSRVVNAQNDPELSESALQAALERLNESELVYRRGIPPLAHYAFKHALVRDAAYKLLVGRRREELHGNIARALEDHFPEIVETEPELLAYHYGRAERMPENLRKALAYLSIARERARSRSALNEAVAQIRQAQQLIAALPDDESRRRQELELQIALVGTLQQQKGYAHPEVVSAYAKARELLAAVSDFEMSLSVYYLLFAAHYIGGEAAKMLDAAHQFLDVAKQQDSINAVAAGYLVIGNRLLGTANMIRGNIAEAKAELSRALTLYDRHEVGPTSAIGQALRGRFVQDVGVTVESYLSWALWLSGDLGEVAPHAEAALAKARRSEHIHSLFYALWHAGMAYILLRQDDRVELLGAELSGLADEHALEYWQALGDFLQGWRATQVGQYRDAEPLLQRGLQRWQNTGAQVFRPICLAFLADAQSGAGRLSEARRSFEEALKTAETTGEHWSTPEIYRLFANAMARENPGAASNLYERAIGLAKKQRSLSFELRATIGLARLIFNKGKRTSARNRLAKVYAKFTDGFDTLDLIEAKSLIDTFNQHRKRSGGVAEPN